MKQAIIKNYTTDKVAYSIKDVLMNAAEQLFIEKGVDATAITDILALTQQKKSVFYHHFASKTELQAAMRARYDRRIYTELMANIDQIPIDKPKQQLQVWIESYITLYINTHHIYDVVYEHCTLNRLQNQQENTVLALLVEIIDDGNMESIWEIEQPKLAAMMIKSGVQAIADDFLADVFNDYQQFYPIIVNYCLKILK